MPSSPSPPRTPRIARLKSVVANQERLTDAWHEKHRNARAEIARQQADLTRLAEVVAKVRSLQADLLEEASRDGGATEGGLLAAARRIEARIGHAKEAARADQA